MRPQGRGAALVLWAPRFDEIAATIFVTTFRRLGIRTKLVGIVRGGVAGARGLMLVPDITMESALPMADHAPVLAIPGSRGAVRRLDNDPRTRELLRRAHSNHSVFAVNPDSAQEAAILIDENDASSSIICYPEVQRMVEFIEDLVANLWSVAGQKP